MQKQNQYKLIRISRKIAEFLDDQGKKNETYDTILTRIFEQNNLLGIVVEDQ